MRPGQDLLRVARARQHALSTGLVVEDVRLPIAASWRRSADQNVPAKPEFDIVDDLDLDTRLARAAHPSLRRLADALSGTGSSVFLANERAIILDRWVDNEDLARTLDEAHSVQGARLDEAAVGTNGLGTVAATGTPLSVTGPEHWAEGYQDLACAGTPVRNPVTHRLEGVVTVTCRSDDNHPLLLTLVRQAALDIERLLLETATIREKALLDVFLSATRRSNRAILAASEDLMICSPSATRLSARIDATALREHIAAAEESGRDATVFFPTEDGGVEVSITANELSAAGAFGVVVELRNAVAALARTGAAATMQLPGLVGSAPVWLAAVHDIGAEISRGEPLVVTGESGVGKFTLVRALLTSQDRPFSVLDAALEAAEGIAGWTKSAERLLASDDYLVVRRTHLLSEATARVLAALIDARPDGASRVVCTSTDAHTAARPGIRALHASVGGKQFSVPALHRRTSDIAPLARYFSQGRSWTAEASAILARHHWEDNVRQLKEMVARVGGHGGPVTPHDLPSDVMPKSGRGALTRLERLEQEAIYEALRETSGNKAAAAALLGMSRSSLYRKLSANGGPPSRPAD